MTTLVRIQETERQSLFRLLDKAKAEGVTIMCDRTDGRHYATSVSKPGSRHYVTGFSCDCRGFMAHQRCKHHAALLKALGWLDVDPEPPTPGMAVKVFSPGERVTCPSIYQADTHRYTGTVVSGPDDRGYVAVRHDGPFMVAWHDPKDIETDPEPPTPGVALAVTHIEGRYERGGWLVTNDCPEWHEPVTSITIDDDDAVRVTGDDFDTQVHWLECDRVVDDLTTSTPTHNHYDAVVHWLRSIDANAPIHTLLQNAGLFPANEFVDDCPLGLEVA